MLMDWPSLLCFLCCLQHYSCNLGPLRELFTSSTWQWEQTNNFMQGPGRGPPIEGMPGTLKNYKDGKFEEENRRCLTHCSGNTRTKIQSTEMYAEICFAVQISCYLDQDKTYNKAGEIISDILYKFAGTKVEFTILTYSDEVQEWKSKWGKNSNKRIKAAKKMKIKKNMCGSQSKTADALEKCKDILQKKGSSNTVITIPKIIIALNDGISRDGTDNPIQPRLDTINKINGIIESNIFPKVVRYNPTSGDGDMEWLAYRNDLTILGSLDFERLPYGVLDDDSEVIIIPFSINKPDPAACYCCKADIAIVLDRSKSINQQDVHTLFHFVHDLIHQLAFVHPVYGAKIAVITFCGEVNVPISLEKSYTKSQLLNRLAIVSNSKRFTTRCQFTHTHQGILKGKEELETYGRQGARKIMIVSTDGRTFLQGKKKAERPPKVTIDSAKLAIKAGIEIDLLGLPNRRDKNDGYKSEWRYIGSKPTQCSVVDMQKEVNGAKPTYDDLKFCASFLANKICCVDINVPCALAKSERTKNFCNKCKKEFQECDTNT